MLPLLSYQKLTNHIDGTTAPSATITSAAAEVLGLTTAHAIWTALETAYSNSSVERIHSLRDSLRNLSKGTSTVSDYGRQFKGICDKLAGIRQPVDEMDKLHWFVYGLGASVETFSTAISTTKPFTIFRDLLSQSESHEMFLKSLHGSATPPAAFFSQQSGSKSSQGRQQRQQNYSRGGGHASNSNGVRGRGGRHPPHRQLCHTNGYYASSCPSLYTYASNAATSDANLSHKPSHLSVPCYSRHPIVRDSGCTAHMTSSPDNVSHSAPYSGNMCIFFGNGDALPVSHIGQSMVSNKILLRDVLVIPKLTKNLCQIRQLTWIIRRCSFSLTFLTFRKGNQTGDNTRGLCEDGLYVLHILKALAWNCWWLRKASFEFGISFRTLCTFLEDGPPISDAPVPESRPTIQGSSSMSVLGCARSNNALKTIHEPDQRPYPVFI
ncbi:putative RNA-directed DNA polymerase [Tanacetum coccineum]|uniref:RNA-directed DNA polymerase n=1 Tax=Tanacetum coccineum TaxID=301880 RepID=A0ABQ5D8Q6_9ASTR